MAVVLDATGSRIKGEGSDTKYEGCAGVERGGGSSRESWCR